MMRRLSIVGTALAALVYSSAASAAETYQFRLNRGIYAVGITPGCEIDGQYTITGAVIQSAAIPPNPTPDLEALTWTQAVLTVCTRFGDVAQERAPIPLSTSLLRNPDLLAVGETVRFGVDPSPAAHMFTGVNPPDIAEINRRTRDIFVFRYYDSATGDLILGPVTIELADPSRLAATPGFDPARHLPIEMLRVVYPIDWLFVEYEEEFSFRIVGFVTN